MASVWMTAHEIKRRYGVSATTLSTWKKKGLPSKVCRHEKGRNGELWDGPKLEAWLRKYPVPKRGVLPKWFALVGHPLGAAVA